MKTGPGFGKSVGPGFHQPAESMAVPSPKLIESNIRVFDCSALAVIHRSIPRKKGDPLGPPQCNYVLDQRIIGTTPV
jgi:hypothetical protein